MRLSILFEVYRRLLFKFRTKKGRTSFAMAEIRVTSEYRLKVAVLAGERVGHFGRKFQVEGNVSHQPFVQG